MNDAVWKRDDTAARCWMKPYAPEADVIAGSWEVGVEECPSAAANIAMEIRKGQPNVVWPGEGTSDVKRNNHWNSSLYLAHHGHWVRT